MAHLRVGLTILPEHPSAETQRMWRALEDLGFDHGWTFDHLGWRSLVEGPWYGTIPTLTVAAMSTQRLELGPLVTSPTYRHPVVLARDLTALDEVSRGRLTLGIGAGGSGYDTEVMGQHPPVSRARRFEEFVELLDALLTSDHVTYDGQDFTARDARTLPGPHQSPRPPFVIAANGPRAMRLAVRHGQGWVTTGSPAETLEQWWASVQEKAMRFTDTEQAHLQQGGEPVRRFLQTDAAPALSTSSAALFEDFLGRAHTLGFTDVVAPWPRREGVFAGREEVVEQIASQVLPRWRVRTRADLPVHSGATSPRPSTP
ncbi:MAG: LLM class flavin-dependent oxidoreductase [Quadrisphaera sp.]